MKKINKIDVYSAIIGIVIIVACIIDKFIKY
jgi:hypothetical protein